MYSNESYAILEERSNERSLHMAQKNVLKYIILGLLAQQELVQKQQPMKLGSLVFIVIGAILTISLIGAIAGLPMLIAASWVQWKARNNLKTIEAAYQAMTTGGG